ncbi:uncharacterized protein BP5553_05655 [Venustampulla echinocandica]|uniref:Major facilitator superfamily (MFS) profile domain-containing protein n=1 Tax=Venustampulla echinocandica TaxID=2656787 RepID=A0A370TLA1_9HELO|nr:uncharacterized protein BP5553_05655 [Venustampulla echinocandica]RDL36303.1 hypothetical protein BP5553_05655 [Venustampulla echinocandica]
MEGGRELDNEPDVCTEETALLGVAGGHVDIEPPHRPSHQSRTPSRPPSIVSIVHIPKVHNNKAILNLLSAIFFVAASASGFASVPLTKIVEVVVCRQYYDPSQRSGEPISEKLCKIEPIQAKVAFLFAITGMCEAAVGFLAAFPWGIVADSVGHRPVFSTALVGMALSVLFTMMVLRFPDVFPTELIALDSAFLLIGGGTAVVWAILLSMISDIFPDDKRATAFMQLQVSGLVGNLVSPALSSAMMATTGPRPAMLVAFSCLMLAAIAFLFVPETLSHKAGNEDEAEQENRPSSLKGSFLRILDEFKKSLSILESP